MNSEDLALFLHVARLSSFSRASMDTGISQSVLSRRITALEAELNTRLFHRSGRGVILTEHGHRLATHATEVARVMQAAMSHMTEAVTQGPASIVIGAQPTVAKMLFGRIGKKLKDNYPGIRIRFREGLGRHIQEWLASGDIDVAVVYVGKQHPPVAVDLVLRERLSLVAPPKHPALGASFPLQRLGEIPMVLPSHPHGLRDLAESIVASYGQTLKIAMECDASIYITKQLVAENCGCTLLPLASVLEEVNHGVLRAVPLANPEVLRDIGILTPHNRPPLPDQKAVIQSIRQELIELVQSGFWPDAMIA